MEELFAKLPAGSIPAWGTLLLVAGYIVVQWMKNKPVLNQQQIDDRHRIKDGYIARIKQLEKDVKDCRDECDQREQAAAEKLQAMQEKINNEALQRVQSEISLVSTLIQVVDAPQLREIMKRLEDRQVRLVTISEITLAEGAANEVASERS